MTVNTFVSGPYRTPESIRRRRHGARGCEGPWESARTRGPGWLLGGGPLETVRRRAPGARSAAGPRRPPGGPLRTAGWARPERREACVTGSLSTPDKHPFSSAFVRPDDVCPACESVRAPGQVQAPGRARAPCHACAPGHARASCHVTRAPDAQEPLVTSDPRHAGETRPFMTRWAPFRALQHADPHPTPCPGPAFSKDK